MYQCVVALRPSRRPASANANAPTQIEQTRRTVGAREDHQRRDGADIVGDQIRAGVNRFDAGHLSNRFGIDRRDLRMRMR